MGREILSWTLRVDRTIKEGILEDGTNPFFCSCAKRKGVDLKLGCPKCHGCLQGGQVLHARDCPSNHACVLARLLNFPGWMTAHLLLSLLKNVDLPLIGSREELNAMYLSDSITLSSLQLNIYQMLGCKK